MQHELGEGMPTLARLAEALGRARVEVLPPTPQYLAVGRFAQGEELPMLLKEH